MIPVSFQTPKPPGPRCLGQSSARITVVPANTHAHTDKNQTSPITDRKRSLICKPPTTLGSPGDVRSRNPENQRRKDIPPNGGPANSATRDRLILQRALNSPRGSLVAILA